jgi:hypothetical protein
LNITLYTVFCTLSPLFIIGNGTASYSKSNAVTVLKNGNVGIGLPNPGYMLDVAGTGNFTGLNVAGTGSFTGFKLGTTSTDGYVLTSDNTGLGTWQPLFGGQMSIQNGMLTFSNDVRIQGKLHLGNSSLLLDGPNDEMYDDSGNDISIQSHSGLTAGNTIINRYSGNVSIGTSSSTYKLDVAGPISSSGSGVRGFSVGDVATHLMSNSPSYGIGMSNVTLTDQSGIPELGTAVQVAGFYGLTFKTRASFSGGADMTIENGNVGIGVTNPSYKLDVAGTGNFTSLRMNANSGLGKVLISDANGNANWSSYLILGDQSNVMGGGFEVDNSVAYGYNIVSKSDVPLTGAPTKLFVGVNTNLNKEVFGVYSDGQTYIGPKIISPSSNHVDFKLSVDGKIVATSIYVIDPAASDWADYVFDKNYKLTPLKELENFIAIHKHLPDIPTTADVKENGVNLSEMNILLLKKVEELTLHLIEMDKKIETMQKVNKRVKKK